VRALGARRWTAAFLLIFAAAIAACARARPTPAAQGPRPVATPRPAPARPSGLLAAARAEAAWARRDDPAALEEAVRFFEQVDAAQQRRFSGAARSDDRDDRAAFNPQ